MAKKARNAISPTREENYSAWYQQVIKAADMAENSDVRGCMVIKPWGYTIWENIQKNLDEMFKDTGHTNAYFPIFIPKSFFEKITLRVLSSSQQIHFPFSSSASIGMQRIVTFRSSFIFSSHLLLPHQ